MALALGAAGIIFTITPQSMQRVEKVNRKLPIVIMGDRSSSSSVDTVELDNYNAGRFIARHMLDLGHKHIAFITAMMNSANAIRLHRLQGVLTPTNKKRTAQYRSLHATILHTKSCTVSISNSVSATNWLWSVLKSKPLSQVSYA